MPAGWSTRSLSSFGALADAIIAAGFDFKRDTLAN